MPETHIPALDPNIRQAYWGKCLVSDAPFSRMVPLGYDICPHCGAELPEVRVEESESAKAGGSVTALAEATRRVEFYYSSTEASGETFPCDTTRALELVQQLRAKGVDCTAIDVAGMKDRFPIYHKAVSGPPASMRPVFGFKGALVEDFGGRVPALLIFEGDRYPSLVYPRTDRERGLIRVELALEELLTETGG